MGRKRKKMSIPKKIEIKIPEKELWRIDEVAKFFDVNAQTVYRWCNEGKLNFCRICNSIRIPRECVVSLMKEDV